MSEELLHSWNTEEDLERLAAIRRNREITNGIVSSVKILNMPVENSNGKLTTRETEVAIIRLPGGIKAYCPKYEFSQHEFKTLTGFVGTQQEFLVTELDLQNRTAIVSIKQADEIKGKNFWNEIEELEKQEELASTTYEGVISGINPSNQNVFVRVNGVDCFMNSNDWNHGRVRNITTEVERGARIPVRVLRFNKESNLVQVSRKAAIPDPFEYLEELQNTQAVVGKVSTVHPIHGIFIKLENGLEVKGSKPRDLPEPVVGEVVSCVIKRIDKERRHCKVVIINYPQGKKTRKDIGAFLFE